MFQLVIPFQLELRFPHAPAPAEVERRSGRERRAAPRGEGDRRRAS